MRSVSRLSPRTSCRLNAPRGRSAATSSASLARAGRSALTVTTLRSTSMSIESRFTPGRSNSTWNVSPSRQASIGMTEGRARVPLGPKTCWVSRSRSRKGSVRMSIVFTSVVVCLGRCRPATTAKVYGCRHRFLVAPLAYLAQEAATGRSRKDSHMTAPDGDRGVYGISVAADLVGMGVQNLRLYESRGLLEPERTDGGTRRYSANDLDRLRRIGELLGAGLNLAGVGMVLDLEQENARLRAEQEDPPWPVVTTGTSRSRRRTASSSRNRSTPREGTTSPGRT